MQGSAHAVRGVHGPPSQPYGHLHTVRQTSRVSNVCPGCTPSHVDESPSSSLRGSSRNSPSVTKVEVGRRPVDPLGPSGPSPVAKAEVGRRPVDALDPSGPPPLAKAEVGRRAVMLLASSLITLLGASGTSQAAIDSLAPTAPLSPPEDAELSTGGTEFDCSKQNLSGEIAFATLKAVYLTLVEQKVMDEKQFQIENFKFKDREYRYYYEAHKDEIPAIPDLSDLTGGLSNKVYFNFVNYSLWKTVARNLKGRDERAAFCKAAGASLLDMIWPEGVAQAKDLASNRDDGRVTQAQLVMLFEGLYSKLKEGGFLCAYLISWGDLPGGWGADWMTNGVLQSDLDPPSKEEDALAAIFQVKAQQPADIGGSVALRSEEDGFWSRSLPTMSSALMTAAGYPDVIVDDYFYQDEWEGPTGLFDKFLLLIGDPLEMVDIPFTPSTLVQNFIVADM